jgi:hypothetical protein
MGDAPNLPDHGKSPVEYTEELLRLFRWERFAFLALSTLAGIVVIYAGIQALQDNDSSSKASAVHLFFGSGGVASISVGGLLTMVTKVTNIALKFSATK